MGPLRLTLCTGILAALAVTPAAYAADGRGVSVSPSTPTPGADVALRVTGCSGKTATATSTAFVADAQLTADKGTLAGDTRIDSTTKPGPYDVKIRCADFEIRVSIHVVKKGAAPSAPPSKAPSAPASPVAPVHAGGGGSAPLAEAEAQQKGPGTAHAVTGLVLAGVAAAAVALLSARRRRGAD
ncbi:hypothetical protein ACIQOU_33650 [Streptomyces sp. NPDC091279]|uniref:hypothetical protein n=1 Tax=unclassified Streptomyces TaxID=2593676 RepID=UPI00381956F4